MNNQRIVVSVNLKRTIKIMKLTFVMLLICLSPIVASTYAQTATVNVSAKNATLESVLKQIEKQSEFLFFYNLEEINKNEKISIHKKNANIQDVLDAIAAKTGLRYTIKDRHIVLTLAEAKVAPVVTQQKQKMSGVVSDNFGPIVGASVIVKGTTTGIVTDMDGNFLLENVKKGDVIQVSFIGYMTQEFVYDGTNKPVAIQLREDTQTLDEVVVVGYGVQKKRDLTGAITSVKMDDAPVGTFTTIGHALAGKAAGLQVSQSSAQVGGGSSFRIRGAASTGAGNDPLIIIDGFPVSGGSDLGSGTRYNAGTTDNILESINPNDIESIEVLKDASSTAIYGSRAGHGVIIITTKRGKSQRLQVQYSGNVSVQNMKNAYEVLDAKEYMQQRNRYNYELYLYNNGLDVYKDYSPVGPEHVPSTYVPRYSDAEIAAAQSTDWFGAVTRTGFQHSHNISLTGGSEKTQFMASLNMLEQAGVVKNNNLSRVTTKVNLDQTISKYVKAGLSFNLSRNMYDNVPIGTGEFEYAGIISSAVRFNPGLPIRDEEGNYTINPDFSQLPNPVSLLEITDKTTKDRFLGSAYAQVEPVKGLILKATLGIDRKYAKRKTYLPKATKYGAAVNGQASINQEDRNDYLMELTANYAKTFGNHNLNALVGYSYQEFNTEGFSAGNQDFLIDAFLYNNLGAGNYARPSVSSWASKTALGSYFGRINYSYLGRYLLTATVRADGASNFDPDNRWGFFPSASLGWRFSDESFMQNANSYLSNGKFRVSYGQTGNSNIGNRTLSYYATGFNNVFGDTGFMGVYASQLGNPNLTWETTSELNVGLDLGFFNNRISASVEYFNRTISDLLVKQKSLPSYNEVTSIASNIGKTKSQGVELTLNTVNIDTKDWSWTTDLSISTYKDRWKERDPNWKPAAYEKVDDPIRAFYAYVSDGLMQVGEKAPAHQAALKPGQVKLVDRNNDGMLNDEDKVLIGSKDPAMIFGFNNTVRFKDFDFNIYFYGEINKWCGASYYDSWASSAYALNQGQNQSKGFIDKWSHDNQMGQYPSLLDSDYDSGDFWLKKVSFIRCRNITLGYTIPVSKKILQRIRVYGDVNNPFVISNWNGLDPETDNGNQFAYPNVTSFSFGVDVTF
ncbi:MAG: TonB-dependent receptor [Parabacteroides sp.]|nr:TonB-dependent receptor [Parabacteroides sp.]